MRSYTISGTNLINYSHAIDGRIALILGLRRMGKSSLLRSFLNSYNIPHILIDARRIILNEGGMSIRGFMNELSQSLTNFLQQRASFRDKLIGLLRNIDGISIGVQPLSISISWRRGRAVLTSLLEAVNRVAEDLNIKVVLAIDEVQELRALGLNIPMLLAYIYDNLGNIVAILTGSQVGMVYDTLRLNDPKSPLYGRAVVEVKLRRLSPDESLDFLRRGFEQYGVQVGDDVIREAASRLDGIIGWLTLFGWYYVHGNRDLNSIIDVAARQEIEELKSFLTKSRAENRYKVILRIVAEKPRRWSEIKRAVEMEEGVIVNDRNFTDLLRHLINMGILEKQGDAYKIADPVLEYGVRKYLR
ncbi:ATP-binding protein [Vulcanisaeta sp. JCM 16161]|uniref:AAA family ATPase n=1 Tax=Vulcanisaeta sp. JCM 16161 TaxID=1295372 RepID=UPI000A67DF4A|nr:ATP-binding protein [Vulcanisaeta sp. JCM 16161]